MKILVLEPYYGGSHKSFIKGLQHHIPYEFDLITLPARKWKWRMRLAAPYFADILQAAHQKQYDRILCSTFVDVAALRALLPARLKNVPVATYYHENQFAYPVQVEDERDFHFALTNITTALASDTIAFNTQYNLDTFLDGTADLLKKTPDIQFPNCVDRIRAKASILYPGIDLSEIDNEEVFHDCVPKSPVIIWNHRWEHDKNPEFFFESLFELDKQNIDFQLIILGQSFQNKPPIFEEARQRLSDKMLHIGYVNSRKEYIGLLKCGDFIVSTANHEFFGISVIEAVRAGCRPLLPTRLSYAELFDDSYLYQDEEFSAKLTELLATGQRLDHDSAEKMTRRFSWEEMKQKFADWLEV